MSSGSSNNVNNPTGRSPFPPTRRTRVVRPSLDNASEGGEPQHSPYLQGLLRFSPKHHGPSDHWSPHQHRWSTKNSSSRTFFGGNTASNNSAAGQQQSDGDEHMQQTTSHNTKEGSPEALMDGLPLDKIRALAKESLHNTNIATASASNSTTTTATTSTTNNPQNQQATFYASLVYAKTHDPADALLLARSLLVAGNYAACLRTLEQSSLLQSAQPWTALLVACAALAAQEEWTSLVQLLEDACRLPENDAGSSNVYNNNNASNNGNRILADDDEFAWSALEQAIGEQQQQNSEGEMIHWLARICTWRGHAYLETGHAQRAALYWKRALQIDPHCQEAWECLQTKHLLTPAQAYEFVAKHITEPSWLRALYMARLELTAAPAAPKDTAQVQQQDNVPEQSFASFGLDASAIPKFSFASPGTFQTPPLKAGATENDNTTKKNINTVPPVLSQDTNLMFQEVAAAFDQLWNDYKLQDSPAVLAMAARRALKQYDWQRALQYCQDLSWRDPAVTGAAYVYLATLVRLGHKRVLFQLAHDWVEAAPRSAQAWFAVGAYYYACQRYHIAQRHFCRATRLDPNDSEAWIAFGCAFAACDESDQALASFRAAQRLAPGEHTSLLYMGMEYVRTNHLVLGQYFLNAALSSSGGGDALCSHEMGVLQMSQGEVSNAARWFEQALITACSGVMKGYKRQEEKEKSGDDSAGNNTVVTVDDALEMMLDPYWEPTVFNLGHCYRRMRRFDKAEACFRCSIGLAPQKASTYVALAFTKHLARDLDTAISYYHQALSIKSDDPVCSEMLQRALEEQSLAWADGENVDDNERVATTRRGERLSSIGGNFKEGDSVMQID